MEKVVLISHCLLNKLSKVKSNDPALTLEFENKKKLLNKLINDDIQIIQLPCPEFLLYGHKRWGHVKEQFNNPFFKNKCEEILKPIILQLQEYQNNNIEIIGVIGIDNSPSCGIHYTCSSQNYGGELTDNHLDCKIISESGIFMEVFKNLIKDNLKKEINFYDLNEFLQQNA